ncbi:hypothetical protein [Hyphomonas atlantica corrig.]|uniref:hypothetical protein n=1 Tax=Hyphomonas atlantica TaxID=1280948 RepID=UPI00235468C4|nr:hypothetical protein [Hyphomonas atlantica]
MHTLADEFFDRISEFEGAYEWEEHDDGKSILALIGELIEHMTTRHHANISMAALTKIMSYSDLIEWDWSMLSKVHISADWRAELEEAMSYSIFDGPYLFDHLHDLHAFAYYGILPGWRSNLSLDATAPAAAELQSRYTAQHDVAKWVESVCAKIDEVEQLLPASRLKDGLFENCARVRTAARARLAYDKGEPLTVAELAALSGVSMKRLQNAIYAKTDEAPLVGKKGKIAAENARPWLEARDYKPSLWQAVEKLQPLKPDWGEDVPYGSDTPEVALADYVFVPVANDGSEFLPDVCWRKGKDENDAGYTIGAKGAEQRISDYRAALDLLARMDTPRWRRPNADSGNWGIVTGHSWRRVALESLQFPNPEREDV